MATTIKVSERTRDRVRSLAEGRHVSAEQVVLAGLDLLDREERRRAMAEQSRALLDDPADRADVEDVAAVLSHVRAW